MVYKSKQAKEKRDFKKQKELLRRAFFVILFTGSIATAVFLGALVANPEPGHLTLAAFNTVNAIVFFILAIK